MPTCTACQRVLHANVYCALLSVGVINTGGKVMNGGGSMNTGGVRMIGGNVISEGGNTGIGEGNVIETTGNRISGGGSNFISTGGNTGIGLSDYPAPSGSKLFFGGGNPGYPSNPFAPLNSNFNPSEIKAIYSFISFTM